MTFAYYIYYYPQRMYSEKCAMLHVVETHSSRLINTYGDSLTSKQRINNKK